MSSHTPIEIPTREEILSGIEFEPVDHGDGVPAAISEADTKAEQDYLIAWVQGYLEHVGDIEKLDARNALKKGHDFGCALADIDPAGEVGSLMAQLRAEINPDDLAAGGLELDSHVTVRYGILPGADLNGLRAYLRSLDPFDISFGPTSLFAPTASSDNAAVVKVDVYSPVLEEINAAIALHADFMPATFDYHPHATVAYVDPAMAWKYTADYRLEGKTQTVSAVSIAMPGLPHETVQLTGAQAPWKSEKLAKYNADQPRDDHGRWTTAGAARSAIEAEADDRGAKKVHSRLLKDQKAFSQMEAAVVRSYTGSGYRDINTLLRTGENNSYFNTADLKDEAKALTAAINARKLSEDVTLYRGGTFPRDFVGKLKQGVTISDKAFTSASTSLATAKWFVETKDLERTGSSRVIFRIDAKAGERALVAPNRTSSTNVQPRAYEVVMAPDARFNIGYVHRLGSGSNSLTVVTLERLK